MEINVSVDCDNLIRETQLDNNWRIERKRDKCIRYLSIHKFSHGGIFNEGRWLYSNLCMSIMGATSIILLVAFTVNSFSGFGKVLNETN